LGGGPKTPNPQSPIPISQRKATYKHKPIKFTNLNNKSN
jgi:hypothetical protein